MIDMRCQINSESIVVYIDWFLGCVLRENI